MKKKRILAGIGIFVLIISVMLLAIVMILRCSYTAPQRVDTDGRLYYIEYKGDYYSPLITLPYDIIRPARKGGCSAFFTADTEGGHITGRNYDLAHLDPEGKPTGLNVVIRCAPKGKYRSVGVADAQFLSLLGVPYYAGALDDGKTDTIYLSLLPYLTMDGINEKGLAVSILALDTKAGETAVYQDEKGKPTVMHPVLLRQMLDSCATVEEAVTLASKRNVVSTVGKDFHLFVTDAEGVSAVIEWRNDKMEVTYTDIVTNFIVSSDDAEDCYYDGALKEKYMPPEDDMGYRFGYGHGYERFKGIMRAMAKRKDGVMDTQTAADTLRGASQEYTGEMTSLTQYSAVYHNDTQSADIWVYPDYTRCYHYDVQ